MPLGKSGFLGMFLQGLAQPVQGDGSGGEAFRDLRNEARNRASQYNNITTRNDLREMRHQVERLSLLNQALWEIIQDRLQVTDAELERIANDIDMRDGVADGKITTTAAMRCPKCNRVSNAKHYKCLYCGQLFEKPAFG